MLTKAATSGILSALGNYLAQLIEKNRRKEKRSQNLDVIGPLRYAIYGFFCTGPLSHCFYLLVERWIPAEAPLAGVQRLLLERARFAPACLLLFFLSMDLLEGRSMAAFSTKMREGFWPALRTNWEVWTPVQFINLNYVPLQCRVLFANLVSPLVCLPCLSEEGRMAWGECQMHRTVREVSSAGQHVRAESASQEFI
ncbi:peroxisomal membrane protein 2 isoform X3 [Choloepus didactylus]|uniref:peroxisomal membrane protein 2 isoform X3 n=1 Tax=Choloepus didactylus TaxID=27675 RepID=UPI0018A0EDDB|nr:peroxisomal membrane protein 2 isoform X3 [Choloepus didactylus]